MSEHRPRYTRIKPALLLCDLIISIGYLLPQIRYNQEKTNTRKGLRTTVQIVNKVYETGRKVAEDFKENMTIVFDKYLSIWNYRAIPNGKVI